MEKVSDAHKGEKESQSLKNASKTAEKEIQSALCGCTKTMWDQRKLNVFNTGLIQCLQNKDGHTFIYTYLEMRRFINRSSLNY